MLNEGGIRLFVCSGSHAVGMLSAELDLVEGNTRQITRVTRTLLAGWSCTISGAVLLPHMSLHVHCS